MLHEVYSIKFFQDAKPDWQKYLSSFHVSTTQVAAIAAAGKPKQLVIYHQLFRRGEDVDAALLEEVKTAGYKGAVASAHTTWMLFERGHYHAGLQFRLRHEGLRLSSINLFC